MYADLSDLMTRPGFEAHIGTMTGASIVHQWGDASVAKLGSKIFALLSGWSADGRPGLSFKCSDISYLLLPSLPQIRPAPYLWRSKWVQVLPDSPLTSAELRDYLAEAHRIVAGTLTRKARAELGL